MSDPVSFMPIRFEDVGPLAPAMANPIDTSYAHKEKAIGRLRMPFASNGSYSMRHPIRDAQGEKVGALVGGMDTLGYTYRCVYADEAGCFFLTTVPVGVTTQLGNRSYISVVDMVGELVLTGKGSKFARTHSFSLPDRWVSLGTEIVFKLINEGQNLLYLCRYGFCFLDTRRREMLSKVEFGDLSFQACGHALSPKVNLLAVAFSAYREKDVLDGSERYANFIRLYDLDRGLVLGEAPLPGDAREGWSVWFSQDGRKLAAKAGSKEAAYELAVQRA